MNVVYRSCDKNIENMKITNIVYRSCNESINNVEKITILIKAMYFCYCL